MARLLCLAVVAAVGLPSGACAGRRQTPAHAAAVVRAERLLEQGCYACLLEALDALPPPAARSDAIRLRVLMLLAARARQLELRDDPDWLGAARAVARGTAPDEQLMLELAGLSVPALVRRGADPEAELAPERRDELERQVRATLEPRAGADPAAAFFIAHAECLGIVRGPATIDHAPQSGAPLVLYARASCRPRDPDALAALQLAQPRYLELHWISAVAAFSGQALLAAERELDLFEASFRQTPTSALLRGQILVALEEFEPAVAALDHVLAVWPGHPEALLHRMRALGHLGDAVRGEAAADRLVAVGTWYQGEAYFWRAWNRRALGRLDQAAADIETAKRVLYNAAVPKLAGFIAYERGDLALALAELTTSRERNDADCEVLFAIGQVHSRQNSWTEALAAFSATASCARAAQSAADARLEEIAAAPLDAARRERMRRRTADARAAEHAREGLATFQAAASAMRAGRAADARPLAERALGWERWAPGARRLLESLPR